MIAYASRTGTRRNLAVLRQHGWRLLVSATGVWRTEGFPYAIDNGAWTAWQQRREFDTAAFVGVVDRLGKGADWIAVPDIVCGGAASLHLSVSWLPKLLHVTKLLIPVQPGIRPTDVLPFLDRRVGLFVGGDAEWKEQTLLTWGALAKRRKCYLHVGRVNTIRRIKLCAAADAHSFDGTSGSRYSVTVAPLDVARRLSRLEFELSCCLTATQLELQKVKYERT